MEVITVTRDRIGNYLLTDSETEQDAYFQLDYDRPVLASLYGWSPSQVCSADGINCDGLCTTDGTVTCAKGYTASDFIADATLWLEEFDGEEVIDGESAYMLLEVE